MAPKVTSSSNRSSRKPAKPTVVTTSKGRQNRSAVSNATASSGRGGGPAQPTNRVTNASNRTSTGSARVTGTPRPALPPRGGTGGSRPPQSGPVRPSIGNVSGPATSPSRPAAKPSSGPVRSSIGNVSGTATSPAKPPSGPVRPSIGKVGGPATKTATRSGSTQWQNMQTGRVSTSNQPGWPPGTESWTAGGGESTAQTATKTAIGAAKSGRLSGLKAAGKALIGNRLNIATIGLGAVEGALAASNTKWGQGVRDARARNEQATKDAINFGMSKLPGGGKEDQPNSRGKTNIDPYGTSKPKVSKSQERTGTQLAAEMGAKTTPASKPPTPRPSTPRPSASTPSAPPARRSGGAPNPVSLGGDIIRERPSASVARPSVRPSTGRPSAPTSAPKAPPATAKPAAKAPEQQNLFNAPRTGVAKFRTDMNPLGKKIVGTTNFSKSVPSERGFDMTSDYSSSLAIPDKKKRKS